MPSNRQLREEIEALSEELGVSVSTGGLNNAKLTEMASELRAKRDGTKASEWGPPAPSPRPVSSLTRPVSAPAPSAPTEPPQAPVGPPADPPATDAAPAPEPIPPAPEPVNGAPEMGGPPPPKAEPQGKPKAQYTVTRGKSVTSLKGILGSGTAIRPEYFRGGQETLDDLVRRKAVTKHW